MLLSGQRGNELVVDTIYNMSNSTTSQRGVGIAIVASAFQADETGLTPVPRSKDKRKGKISNCAFCKKEFVSYFSHGKWIEHCGRSCTNKNRTFVKVRKNAKRIRSYCECGSPISGYKSKFCKDCYQEKLKKNLVEKGNTISVGDVLKKTEKYKSLHRYQPIRNDAIRILKISGLKEECKVCGYSTHVEVCHIKGIADFTKESLLSEVNDLSNLVYLCPNHHWELDNGIIKL